MSLLNLKLHKSALRTVCASAFDTGTDFRQNLLARCEICILSHVFFSQNTDDCNNTGLM